MSYVRSFYVLCLLGLIMFNPLMSFKKQENASSYLHESPLKSYQMFARRSHEEEGTYFQDIKLVDSDNAKYFVSKNNKYMGRIRDCLSHRLEHEEESEDILIKFHLILDC